MSIVSSSQTFYELVTGQEHEHIIGILCGHVHFPSMDAFRPQRYQYVTTPCFMGGYRIIRIVPLPGE